MLIPRPQLRERPWRVWSPVREPLPDTANVFVKISVCTTCMGRTHDLKETLLHNILDNEDYRALEFVILNYNSPDDMHDFMISSTVRPHIENGRVKYLRTRSPQFYSMSHSRNVAFRNATGHIVTNVD